MSSSPAFQMPSEADPFTGHLGHLTPQQEEALEAFKGLLTEANLYTPSKENTKASHNDPTLLRFLRARSFNPSAAQKQFAAAEAWRKEHDVDRLFASFDPAEFHSSQRFYPRWTGRRDKHGVPLYVYRLASLSKLQKELNAVPPPRRYQRIIALNELMTRFSFPLHSHLPHPPYSSTPISSTTSIIDLQDASFGLMWGLRTHLQQASHLATANYPETLGTVIIINAPSFFPTVWSWVKGWFDEGTRKKIHVLGSAASSSTELLTLINSEDLPKQYGGELQWEFEDEPNLDDAALAVMSEVPKQPAEFIDGEIVYPQ